MLSLVRRVLQPGTVARLPAALVHAVRAQSGLYDTPRAVLEPPAVLASGMLELALGWADDPDAQSLTREWLTAFTLGQQAVLQCLEAEAQRLREGGGTPVLEAGASVRMAVLGPYARAFELGWIDGLEALYWAVQLGATAAPDKDATVAVHGERLRGRGRNALRRRSESAMRRAAERLLSARWRLQLESCPLAGERFPARRRRRLRRRQDALRRAFLERRWLEGQAAEPFLRLPAALDVQRVHGSTLEALEVIWVVGGALADETQLFAKIDALVPRLVPGGRVVLSEGRLAPAHARRARQDGRADPRRRFVEERVAAALLYRCFGFTALRAGQSELLGRTLGGLDTLGVLATGAGKSVCFMLPALVRHGFAVVVCPLTALIRDHVLNLERAGLRCAERLDATVSLADRERLWARLERGELKLLFVTPERFLNAGFQRKIRAIARCLPVSAWVVDEAHCVSEWGHDFRPAYLGLRPHFRDIEPKAPVYALTATASERVQTDVLTALDLPRDALVLPDTLDRVELSFAVERQEVDEPPAEPAQEEEGPVGEFAEAIESSAQLLGITLGPAHGDEPARQAIVYTPLTGSSDWKDGWLAGRRLTGVAWLAQKLSTCLGKRLPLAGYHGRIRSEQQEDLHRRFKDGELALLVSTKAFGMGIDVPHVRLVVHAGLASSLEQYYQEAGRAGRDGARAHALLYHVERPTRCRERYPAGHLLPPCAANPFYRGCAYEQEIGSNHVCSYGLQVHLLSSQHRGPLIDFFVLAMFAMRCLASEGQEREEIALEEVRDVAARDVARFPGLAMWILAKRRNLHERLPVAHAVLERAMVADNRKLLEERWRFGCAVEQKSGRPQALKRAVEIPDTMASRFLVLLRRIGLVQEFAPRYDHDRGKFKLEAFSVHPARPWPKLDAQTILGALCLLEQDPGGEVRVRENADVYTPLLEELQRFDLAEPEQRKQALIRIAALHTAVRYREFFRSRFEMLRAVESYVLHDGCRKEQLLGYFGQPLPYFGPCRRCDHCGIEERAPEIDPGVIRAAGALRELRRLLAEAAIGRPLFAVLDRLVALRAGATGLAMLGRELEERPNDAVVQFARAALTARAWDLSVDTSRREQNRRDFEVALEGYWWRSERDTPAVLGAMLRACAESWRFHPGHAPRWLWLWRRAVRHAGSEARRAVWTQLAEDRRADAPMRRLGAVLWVESVVSEFGALLGAGAGG